MDANERKSKLIEIISEGKPSRTGIPLMYENSCKEFAAYKIPLSVLIYNKYNGRIGSVVKSYERQNHELNPEIATDKETIEKFLWDSKEDANEKTRERLLREHQQKHGIVTADGVIIDGNRRVMLLNSIMNDEKIPYTDKSHCQYFEAIILPEDASKKEILALETTYQMGEDAKVDYNPIEKYLKCKDLKEENFTNEDIANFMGINKGDVQTMLDTLETMDDYLEEYGYDGMYTQLDKNEDSFLKLTSSLKRYRSGIPMMWDYQPDADVTDLKLVAFDYIRAGFDQTLFRNIILPPTEKNPTKSFFANKGIWESFKGKHFEFMDTISEESVADIQKKLPPGYDLGAKLKARDKEWQDKTIEKLRENFDESMDNIANIANAAKPLLQLRKACQALDVVDTTQESFINDARIKEAVSTLEEYVKKFKQILFN